MVVANVDGRVPLIPDEGDDVGRGQGVFAAGREGATGRPLEARGWSSSRVELCDLSAARSGVARANTCKTRVMYMQILETIYSDQTKCHYTSSSRCCEHDNNNNNTSSRPGLMRDPPTASTAPNASYSLAANADAPKQIYLSYPSHSQPHLTLLHCTTCLT